MVSWIGLREHARAATLLPAARRSASPSRLVRLGSSYGGWWVPESAIQPGSIAYCAGAGEDVSFDLELVARGMEVTTFDPTPRAIAHVEGLHEHRLRFIPVGWWDQEDTVKFYAPRNPLHVSHSIVNLRDTVDYFTAAVKPVRQLMTELGDQHINVLKMDIEGAEYRVLDSLFRDEVRPDVLCVEFDQPAKLRRIFDAVRKVHTEGYRLAKIELWNYTFVRTA